MSKISRRGLFGWMAAVAAASPVIAKARPVPLPPPPLPETDPQKLWNYLKSREVEYVPLKVRLPSHYASRPFEIGDKVSWTDMESGPATITAIIDA